MAGQHTGALMNALHAWSGFQLSHRAGGGYHVSLWWGDVLARPSGCRGDSQGFQLSAPSMRELTVLIDRCRLENPRPSLEVEGDPHEPPLGARCN